MPLLDPDEGLYAAIAQEMLSRADWVIPHAALARGSRALFFPMLRVGAGRVWVRPLALGDPTPLRGAPLSAAIAVPWRVLATRSPPTLFNLSLLDNPRPRFLKARRFVED